MKIGLASFFPWRVHNYNLMYVAHLLEQSGNNLSYFSCNGNLSNCYPRLLKNSNRFIECSMCKMGGIQSFKSNGVFRTERKYRTSLSIEKKTLIASSSANTLLRIESYKDKESEEYQNLLKTLFNPIETIYGNTIKWIEKENLDSIILFNGRMEITRAVVEAAKDMKIPFVTYERSLFGNGISFFPNQNCIGLQQIDMLNNDFKAKPLYYEQAIQSAKYGLSRLLYKNLNEWRLYNVSPESKDWPVKSISGPKVLVLPSSKNEFDGQEDYKTEWVDNGIGIDLLKDKLNLKWENFVLRCHPNWDEKIGSVNGKRSEKYYSEWAKRRNIFTFYSNDKVNTHKLIEEADIIVVNNSSSAIQAGILGKNTILLGHSIYQNAGFTLNISTFDDFSKLEKDWMLKKEVIIKQTLRFLYTVSMRFPQYTKFVKALSPLEYEYYEGGDPERIITMINTGKLLPDNNIFSVDDSDESNVISLLNEKQWEGILSIDSNVPKKTNSIIDIKRKFGYRWIDNIRTVLPSGDRINFSIKNRRDNEK